MTWERSSARAVHQVEEPAGGAHHDVDARLQGVQLGVVAHAAVDGQHAGAAVGAGHRQVIGDLQRELAGRGHDESLRLVGRRELVVVGVVRRDRALEHAGCRTPGSCRCPVRAWPMRSVPIRATDSVISWIGKGVMMPTRSRASVISGRTPSSRNVVRVLPVSSGARKARTGTTARLDSRDRSGTAHRSLGGARQRRRWPILSLRCPHDRNAGRTPAGHPRRAVAEADAGGVLRPGLPGGGRRPAGRDRLRRDLRFRAARRGREDGAGAGRQGGAGPDGIHRVRPLRAAARTGSPSSTPTRSRPWRRSSPPSRASTAYGAQRLVRGPRQGLRR